jgi:hypothetical protein
VYALSNFYSAILLAFISNNGLSNTMKKLIFFIYSSLKNRDEMMITINYYVVGAGLALVHNPKFKQLILDKKTCVVETIIISQGFVVHT